MIRKLSEKNYKHVENLLREAFHTTFPQDNPFIHWYIYEVESIIMGFISYSIMYDQLELNYLYVLPSHRKQKIASKLIDYMLKDAVEKNVAVLSLEVNEKNEVARKLYQKFGFDVVAIRKNYYGKEDGLLMIRKLM